MENLLLVPSDLTMAKKRNKNAMADVDTDSDGEELSPAPEIHAIGLLGKSISCWKHPFHNKKSYLRMDLFQIFQN